MKLARVIGKVVSTRKEGGMDGLSMLVVSYLDENLKDTKITAACVDTLQAGAGELVLVCSSSSARLTAATEHAATDNTIVAIVDSVTAAKKYLYKK